MIYISHTISTIVLVLVPGWLVELLLLILLLPWFQIVQVWLVVEGWAQLDLLDLFVPGTGVAGAGQLA